MATTLFIHIGQCGSQVGSAYWALLENTYYENDNEGSHLLFADRRFARSLVIDTNSKSPEFFQRQVKSARPDNIIFDQAGRAGNWARGFNLNENSEFSGRVLDGVRREAERLDRFTTLVPTLGLGGGTGGGLGAALLQWARDEVPKAWLAPVCTSPGSEGRGCLSPYNTCFALYYILEYADAMFHRSNKELADLALKKESFLLQRRQAEQSGGPQQVALRKTTARVSFHDLNTLLACDLAAVTAPMKRRRPTPESCGGKGGGAATAAAWHGWSAGDVLPDLCDGGPRKIVDFRSSFSLPFLVSRHGSNRQDAFLKRFFKSNMDYTQYPSKCYGSVLHVCGFSGLMEVESQSSGSRGKGRGTPCSSSSRPTKAPPSRRRPGGGHSGGGTGGAGGPPAAAAVRLPGWLTPYAWSHCERSAVVQEYEAPMVFQGPGAAAAANQSLGARRLAGGALDAARALRRAGAYAHAFAAHGVGQEDFEEVFEGLQKCVEAYDE